MNLENITQKLNLISYFNKPLMVSILIPDNWNVQQVDKNQFQVFSPIKPEIDQYRSQISYTKTIIQKDTAEWFEGLIKESETKQRQVYDRYQIIQEKSFFIGQHQAYLRHCEWSYSEESLISVNLQSLIWVKSMALYIIKAATFKIFEKTEIPIFKSIIASTRIL